MLQTIRLDRRLRTGPDEDLHRFAARLRHDGQTCAADLHDLILQLLRRESCGALRLVTDDNFRAQLAVLDEEGVGGVERGEGGADGRELSVVALGLR